MAANIFLNSLPAALMLLMPSCVSMQTDSSKTFCNFFVYSVA